MIDHYIFCGFFFNIILFDISTILFYCKFEKNQLNTIISYQCDNEPSLYCVQFDSQINF